MPGWAGPAPFVRLFYGAPFFFVWTDDEGGEQGDPLMPALFALALAPALRSFQEELHPGEQVRAFVDDSVTTSPARIASVLSRLEHHLFASLHIRLHAGKTRVWNSAGVRPPHLPPPPEGSATWVGNPPCLHKTVVCVSLAAPWERTSASLRSSSTFPCSSVLSSSCSLAYMTCKSGGYCCCSVRLLACTTVFGCLFFFAFHLRVQLCSLPNTTATFCAASPSCFTLFPAMPIHSPSADLVSAVRLSTRQLPTSPPGLTRLGHSESVSLTPVTPSLACLMTQHLPRCLSSPCNSPLSLQTPTSLWTLLEAGC